jgi:hypothetical protein
MDDVLTTPAVEVESETPDTSKLPNLHKRAFAVGIGGELKLRWFELRRHHPYRKADEMLNDEFGPRVIELEAKRKSSGEEAAEMRRQKMTALECQIEVSKTAPLRIVAQWVGNHLNVAPEKIDLATVPCRYAMAMLSMAGESKESREDFSYNKYPAMVKVREQGEGGGFDGDGSEDSADAVDLADLYQRYGK